MKHLTIAQLKKWKPCNGQDWITRMKKEYGKKVEWSEVLDVLIREKQWSQLNWIIGKRLEKLNKRKCCAFAYHCAYRVLKYARKQDIAVLTMGYNEYTFTTTITVDRSLSPQEMLDATRRTQYVNKEIVKGMPRGEGTTVELIIFTVEKIISDDELEKEYEKRGLIPASPYDIAAFNDNERNIATHWKDADGKWCCAAFDRWDDGLRFVLVSRDGYDWSGRWFFGGRRKSLDAWSTKMQKQLERWWK
jgi:hypothetical protein